ncbi:hypothetical protein HHK36_000415 [Tetracentron sinense]|uniref:Uncharacterized protein n=1 Tax=Tetracentron sinense TaxID=13715 RepID=A0A834ZS52_TETSI|nr:hypothetical protein HHK36_000415 [Tetracentron sinense]
MDPKKPLRRQESSKNIMEDEMVSTISNSGADLIAEGSDSNSSNNPCQPNKRRRDDNPSFKGVVSQQNGNWGAQIYANHQRIWLGTFKTENAAAMAYDSAAIKLRRGDTNRNFPWNSLTIQEPNFQDLHSTESLLNMIKDGSYQTKFMDFIMNQSLSMGNKVSSQVNEQRPTRQQLFHKELTPSDVGKLNRLVIPKKHAVTYFPLVPDINSEGDEEKGKVEAIQLTLYDEQFKQWQFRYCYWKSSQSFVFTKGWNRFVKEKKLKANDTITFYRCECNGEFREEILMIDIEHNSVERNCGFGGKVELHYNLRETFENGSDREGNRGDEKEKKSVRLFGVQIS